MVGGDKVVDGVVAVEVVGIYVGDKGEGWAEVEEGRFELAGFGYEEILAAYGEVCEGLPYSGGTVVDCWVEAGFGEDGGGHGRCCRFSVGTSDGYDIFVGLRNLGQQGFAAYDWKVAGLGFDEFGVLGVDCPVYDDCVTGWGEVFGDVAQMDGYA